MAGERFNIRRAPTHVIYHHPCIDGFAAAYVCWEAWVLATGHDVTFIPMAYGKPLPSLPSTARVLMVDVSAPRADIEAFKASVSELVILDHHKSAQAELAGLDYAIFDMDRSGVGLVWSYIFEPITLPWAFMCVEDRDLWRFKLPDSPAIHAALASYPQSFEVWRAALQSYSGLVAEGKALIRARDTWIQASMGRVALHAVFFTDDEPCQVPVMNATDHQSEVGHALLEAYPKAPFAATYLDRGLDRVWSLRARTPGVDVSEIAKHWGGGGHRAAAGFTTPVEVCHLYQLPRLARLERSA